MKRDRFQRAPRQTVRLSLPTVGILVAVVGGGAFAAGQSMSNDSPPSFSSSPPSAVAMPMDTNEGTDPLPPGHPPIDSVDPVGAQMAGLGVPAAGETSLEWQAPARWQLAPNASAMRLATYRVPRAPGDPDDAELSITQAGGSIDANAARWIGQFDAAGQNSARRSTRKVGPLEVTMVEVQGAYSAAMGKELASRSGWALLGAIVATPGTPHFFKLTGPAKTVRSARAEFDAMIGTLAPR
jgi:hypothetical protein